MFECRLPDLVLVLQQEGACGLALAPVERYPNTIALLLSLQQVWVLLLISWEEARGETGADEDLGEGTWGDCWNRLLFLHRVGCLRLDSPRAKAQPRFETADRKLVVAGALLLVGSRGASFQVESLDPCSLNGLLGDR